MGVPRNPVTPNPFVNSEKQKKKTTQTSDILLQECKEGLGHEKISTVNAKGLTQLWSIPTGVTLFHRGMHIFLPAVWRGWALSMH